ncbi:hypothetical protein VdG1_08281 [Verticillium dahliae VDG1]|nr:hypothetical protein VdG1_08281 [Verticillium dahliae VDG1]
MSIADIPSPLPTYLYKIIPTAPPATLPQEWPLSDLDRKDGYIHLSTARQNFGAAEIVDARELRRGEAQVWGIALEGEVWLE